jgi:acetylornithine/N-succinyldiaminopimelate aminotransferase
MERHALITAIGSNVNRMIPPLIATKEDVDRLMEIMKEAITEAAEKYNAKTKVA